MARDHVTTSLVIFDVDHILVHTDKGAKEPSKPSNALSASARVLKVTMAQQHCFLGVRPRA